MGFGLNVKTIFDIIDDEENKNNQEIEEINMELYSIPYNTPIIINIDKTEEFLNTKSKRETIEKRLQKYKHLSMNNAKEDTNRE